MSTTIHNAAHSESVERTWRANGGHVIIEMVGMNISGIPPRINSDTLGSCRWFIEDGMLFHGVQPEDIANGTGPGAKSSKIPGAFHVYKEGKKLHNPDKWDTHSAEKFCSHCVVVKRFTHYTLYKCMGHPIS